MSNRIKRNRIDVETAERIRRVVRCPDCLADVRINRRKGRVGIGHDESCPSLRALTRSGRSTQVIVTPTPGQSAGSYAEDVSRIAGKALTAWPGGVRIASSPYADLDRTKH